MKLANDQVVNAACLFAIVFTLCLIVSITLYFFLGTKIDASFVKDIFSIGSTLFIGLLGIALYTDWRIQKQYDLEKVNAEEIIENFTKLNLHIHQNYYSLIPLKKINERFIAVNDFDKYKNIDLSYELNLLRLKFNNLNSILLVQINEDFFNDLEIKIQVLKLSFERIEDEYKKYYSLLDPKFKEKKETVIQDFNNEKHPCNAEFICTQNHFFEYINNGKIKIEVHNQKLKNQVFDYTLDQYKEHYDNALKALMQKLFDIVKPHKKTAQ